MVRAPHERVHVAAALFEGCVRLDRPLRVVVQEREGRLDVTTTVETGQPEATSDEHAAALAWVRRRFQLHADFAAFRSALGRHEFGEWLAERFWPLRPALFASPWEALLRFSLSEAEYGRTLHAFGPRAAFESGSVVLAPSPEELAARTPSDFVEAGLSWSAALRLETLSRTLLVDADRYDLTRWANEAPADLARRLRALPGLGASGTMSVLARGVGHPDVALDYAAARRLAGPWFDLGDRPTYRAFSEAMTVFSPFRSWAAYYALLASLPRREKYEALAAST